MNNVSYILYLENFSFYLESNYVSPKAQLLYMRLLMVFNKVGWPESITLSNYKLMDMLCCGVGTMAKARDELISLGFLKYESGNRFKPGKYCLAPIDNVCYNDNVENDKESKVDAKEDNTKKPQTKKKEEPKEKCIGPDEWGFGEELTEAFSDWLQYKKERKESYKPTGLKMLVSEIRNRSKEHDESEIVDVIKQCIARGWKGIIWDLLPKKEVPFDYDDYYKVEPGHSL